MPTYDFRCPAGHDFERFFGKISDAPSEVACPECGAVATRRISGGAGLVFKGSGFYITDYGKDGKKDLKSAAPKTDAGGTTKSGDGGTGGSSSSGGSGGAGGSGTGGASGAGGSSGGSSGSGGGGATGGSSSKSAGGE